MGEYFAKVKLFIRNLHLPIVKATIKEQQLLAYIRYWPKGHTYPRYFILYIKPQDPKHKTLWIKA